VSYQSHHGICRRCSDYIHPSSRSWIAEEGEIFRKGNKLLGPEEMEGEYAGEELRMEVRAFLYYF
jgi:hypothetical protein